MNPNRIRGGRGGAASLLLTGCLMLGVMHPTAQAQSEASLAVSALPVASVLVGGAAVSALPAALSLTGAVLVVKTVEVTARGTVWVLERASDGAQVSVELSARTAQTLSITTGVLVTVSVIGTGVVLSVAGELLCFIPNELGRALFHHERLSH
jgi:hypothetical protein